LLSAQLLTEVILGLDFLINYGAEISFPEQRITLRINEEVFSFEFTSAKEPLANCFCDLGLLSIHSQTQHQLTAVNIGHRYTNNLATGGVYESVKDQKRETGTCIEDSEHLLDDDKECECLLIDDNEASVQQSKRNCVESVTAAKNERGYKLCQEGFTTFAEGKESQNADGLFSDKYELIKDNNGYNNKFAGSTSLCLATTCPKTDDVTSPQESGTNKLGTDDRTISEEQLRIQVCKDSRLSTEQQEDLYNVLAKYRQHLTKRPGKCTQFVYEFKIEGSMPHSANSRPFALRNQVREQIQAMLKDGILEESHSAYINPITLVVREGKAVRICLDARRINKQLVADRTKVMPMRELLQKVYGAKYITNLDLSSAFLQILDYEVSRWLGVSDVYLCC
jgi:hypothetical protein